MSWASIPPLATAVTQLQTCVVCCAGEYTAERLKELRAGTPLLPASKKPSNPLADGSLGIIKLSGSFKPAGAPKDDRFSISGAHMVGASICAVYCSSSFEQLHSLEE